MKTILGGAAATIAIAISSAACAAPAAPVQQGLPGYWVGTYEVGADINFLRPHFTAAGKATVDLPSFEKKGLPLDGVQQEQGKVRFALPGPDGVLQFDGSVRGDLLAGKVTLNGKEGKFAFRRTLSDDPQRHQPLLGAYQFPDKHIVVLSEWGDFPQMFYSDMRSGRYASMFADSDSTYYAGAGNLNPAVRETTMRFEKDKSGNVARMVWQQDGKRQTARRLQFRSEEVTFRNGDVTLSGTLVLPEGKGPFPAVVLTQMSSPAPRGAYALQAYYFAAHGMAALMYDKRGVGKSTGEFNKATMEQLADDAVAGIELLGKRADINAQAIGTWGHSQGGWLAPLAASRSQKVAFVIAQAASGVPPAEQEVYRIENVLRASGFSDDEVRAGAAYQEKLMRWVTSGGANRAELLAAARAGDNARWASHVEIVPDTLRDKPRAESTAFYSYDPLPDLKNLKAPVVYILGEKDAFVPVHKSAALFKETLDKAGHKDHQVWMLPRAAHGLWETDIDGGNAYINSTHWAREHYPRMTQWLRERGFIK
ncbi:alpha/beta fold hydrolase [Duganella sp. FT92W]|uniref:Alpha/beta fold hydrolase n=1 Tax=Pseudoduganella rivuli TaxID=2666085 RepID=A0A7X2IKH9_9BURK|nr:alpha/beta fold hydrolase [Pseudoduganella rivuli]MRV71153.1 alpha/beta fold hydrolase [Pseudoduganella rivuli]